MHEAIINFLKKVGLPEKEAIIYLDILHNKGSRVVPISRRTRMHRANLYDILYRLEDKNLIQPFLDKEGKKVYVAQHFSTYMLPLIKEYEKIFKEHKPTKKGHDENIQ